MGFDKCKEPFQLLFELIQEDKFKPWSPPKSSAMEVYLIIC